ncbi:hypothetical protein [Halosimplex halophilum]|uniref:hypothetical protein n=1 Tax=Halosimplex halophilum TaxID=2559572 RepID=UPI00107FB681|nr:hypothetical protein [Halosimplex halophilum]
MTVELRLLGLVALVNVLGGVVVGLLVLKGQEAAPRIAPLPGLAFGGFAVWGQLVVGDRLNPTVPELESLVLVAVASALVGLVGVFSTLEAEAAGR